MTQGLGRGHEASFVQSLSVCLRRLGLLLQDPLQLGCRGLDIELLLSYCQAPTEAALTALGNSVTAGRAVSQKQS